MQKLLSKDIAARAIRMVLVFALVFWMSFRVEGLAFAQIISDQASDHDGEMLTDFEVWQVTHLDKNDNSVLHKKAQDVSGMVKDDEQPNVLRVAKDGEIQFVALPKWQESDEPGGDEPGGDEPGGDEPGGDEPGGDEPGGNEPGGDEPGGDEPGDDGNDEGDEGGNDSTEVSTTSTGTQPAPAYEVADDDLVIADFMKWKVDDASTDVAEITEKDGVATLVGKSPGIATVVCYPDGDEHIQIDSNFDPDNNHDFEVRFNVQVVYVSSLEVYSESTGERVDNNGANPLVLTDDEKSAYAFKVRANTSTGNEADGTQSFDASQDVTLSSASEDLLHDLKWEVVDEDGNVVGEDVATITENGVLTMVGEGPVIVRCTTPNGLNGDYAESVVVKTGKAKEEKEDIQGESHPQNSLTVIVQRPQVKLDTSNSDQEEGSEGSENPENPDDAEGDVGEEGEVDVSTTAEDDEPASEESESGETEGDGATESDNASESSEDTQVAETQSVYTVDLANQETGVQLDVNEKTYSMTLDGTARTVSGRGTTLALLLNDAGVTLQDQESIESLEFVNVFETHTTVPWTELVLVSHSEATYIMVAKQAYVHEPEQSDDDSKQESEGGDTEVSTQAEDDEPAEGEPTEGESDESGSAEGEPAEGEGDAAENEGQSESQDDQPADPFLDNTRFQILFDQPEGGGSINANDLRWVHTIIVHMKGAEAPESLIGELKPVVDYTPVPKGTMAFLTAVPPTAIGSASFGYKWERSKDGGSTWDEVGSDTQQTIQVMTDDEHLGNQYRVSVITDDGLSEPSAAVTIQEGSGFVVQLDYVPPLAGDWANFTSHVIGANGVELNDPNIQYRWEQSTDGGQSWQVIPNEAGKTLRVKTNPISQSDSADSGGDGGSPVLTYIHVVAVLGSDSSVSNRQLLTVRVGDADGSSSEETGGDEKSNEIEQAMNGGNANQVPETPSDQQTPSQSSGQTKITPIEVEVGGGADDEEEPEDPDDSDVAPDNKKSDNDSPAKASTESSPKKQEATDKEDVKPTEKTESIDISSVIVDDSVSEKIMEQNNKEAQQKEATPGARWTEISAVNASQEDIRRVLAGNPMAPFAAPFALGLTAAGVVEKLVGFRRQVK